jgi:hypothetical protein
MSVNSTSRSSGGTTKTSSHSGGNTKSTNGASKTSKSSGSGATSKAKTAGGGFFSKLFGGGQSTFEHKATGTTKATKTSATATKAKGKNGVAHITSYTKKGQRGQMASGTITVNGKTYKFNSGGAGKGNLPKGTYTVTRHMNTRTDKKSMMVGGVGYSFALSNKYDARVGATRTALRIHPDGGAAGTIGCIGIVGDRATQQRFRDDMNRELSRSGGHYSLTVN